MSRSPRLSWRIVSVVALAVLGACGGGEPGPTADPEVVVREAPALTEATGSAQVTTTGPYASARGTVRFAEGTDELSLSGRNTTETPWGVQEPVAMLDLVRGVVRIDPYGGSEVQGIGTKRYQVDIDLAKAIAATPASRRADLQRLSGRLGDDNEVWADVFVDAAGRVRRILVPVQTEKDRPYGDSKLIPQLVSVDFFDFGKVR